MLAVLSKAPADGDRGEKRLQVRVEFAGYEEAAVLDAASQTRHASADSREYVGSCSACVCVHQCGGVVFPSAIK